MEIIVQDVSISYQRQVVIDNVSFTLSEGETLSLIGPNGSGKTTLLNALLGIKSIDQGKITINGLSPKLALRKYKGSFAYLPQYHQLNNLLPITVYEVIAQSLRSQKFFGQSLTYEEKVHIDNILDVVQLNDKKNELFINLSGGQKQRALLGLALSTKPRFLFLDEPTNTLDIASIEQIYTILSELKKTGIGILLISHDISSIVSHSDKIGVLMQKMHYFGAPKNLPESLIHKIFGSHIKIIPDPNCKECQIS